MEKMDGNVSACHVLTGVLSNVHVVCLSGCSHNRCCDQGENMKLEIALPQLDILLLPDLCSILAYVRCSLRSGFGFYGLKGCAVSFSGLLQALLIWSLLP